MAEVTKKRGMRTVRVPPGLPSPKKAVDKPKAGAVREVKTVQGEVIKEPKKSLSKPKSPTSSGIKKLPAPDNLRPDLLPKAKKAAGQLLKRAGAVGAAATAGFAIGTAINKATGLSGKIVDALSPSRSANPNVDVTGKSTRILMSKKAPKVSTTPTTKPEAPKPKGISKTRKAFNAAFRSARTSGAKEFTFRGKRFNTKLAK